MGHGERREMSRHSIATRIETRTTRVGFGLGELNLAVEKKKRWAENDQLFYVQAVRIYIAFKPAVLFLVPQLSLPN